MIKPAQKLYAYVDESGQDTSSKFFVVVAVVTIGEQDRWRNTLEEIERTAGTGRKKWHKLRHINRVRYLTLVMERRVAAGEVFVAHYKKPIPFFFPLVEVLDWAIRHTVVGRYEARIYVDGIDQQKAGELTNALRAKGIALRQVRSRRDESEPLIRLADMWAGCVRGALLKDQGAEELLRRAKMTKYTFDLSP